MIDIEFWTGHAPGGRLAAPRTPRRPRFPDRPHRWLSYEHHIELYLKPGLGHLPLAGLRDTDFEELYAAMRLIGGSNQGKPSPMLARLLAVCTDTRPVAPLIPNRIRTVHATVRSALNAAVKRRKIAHNPVLYVELERVRKPRALVWTDERVTQWRRTGSRPSPGDGVDTDPDRRLPRRGCRRPALRALAPAHLPRTATV